MPYSPYNKIIYGDEYVSCTRASGMRDIRVSIKDVAAYASVFRHPGYSPARYYPLGDHGLAPTAVATALNTAYAYPFVIEEPISVTNFVVYMTTAATSSTFKAAIYSSGRTSVATAGAVRWVPSTPVIVANTAAASATATAAASVAPSVVAGYPNILLPGLYWAMSRFSVASTPNTVPASPLITKLVGGFAAADAMNAQVKGLTTADTFTANWAAYAASTTWTQVTGTGAMPLLGIQAGAPTGYYT